jgi:hypothetical protein
MGLEELQATRTVWAQREDRANGITRVADTPAAQPAPAAAPMQFASAAPPAAKAAAPRQRTAAPLPAAADAKPMSEWRRAYIAKHGREPPVAAK